jgi:hypothetical protein
MKNSLASLDRLQAAITARSRDLRSQGINLVSWGVDVRANRVAIGVKGLTPEAAQILYTAFGADRVVVSEGQQLAPTSKTFDSPPWFGGILIQRSSDGGPCTAGYAIQNGSTPELTSAGHCRWDHWINGASAVGDTTWLQYASGQSGDYQFIAADAGAAGLIYTSEDQVHSVHAVATQFQDSVGALVCTDGYRGGEICGVTVTGVNQCAQYTDGNIICGLTLTRSPNNPATVSGDSGGPVYHYNGNGDTSLVVHGIISAVGIQDPTVMSYTPQWLITSQQPAVSVMMGP